MHLTYRQVHSFYILRRLLFRAMRDILIKYMYKTELEKCG